MPFFERMKFSLVGLVVSVCMSMSVWSEKKKEETKNNNIHSHTHTLNRAQNGNINLEVCAAGPGDSINGHKASKTPN